MGLSLLPVTEPTSVATRRRGRPNLADSSEDAARMVECAKARLLYGATRAKMARYYGVSRRTVVRWTNRALELDGPESEALRRLLDDRRAS